MTKRPLVLFDGSNFPALAYCSSSTYYIKLPVLNKFGVVHFTQPTTP